MGGSNSTLNIINIEIQELKAKQLKGPLGIIEIKKLQSLVTMRKDLSNTQTFDEYEQVDEDVFSDDEVLEFLEVRKKNEESKQNRKLTTQKKKTPKKRKKKVSKG